jgi:NlpC/P60 family
VTGRNLHRKRSSPQDVTTGIRVKPSIAILLFGLALCLSLAQEDSRQSGSSSTSRHSSNANYQRKTNHPISPDDGLALIAAALDSKTRLYSLGDCSHLVHAIYKRAGFTYVYARSSDLYLGVEEFVRVAGPQPGDLVVWPGHVGIVIRPSRHVFFSLMRRGPGIDDYEAPYWTRRGRARFYRYVQNVLAQDVPVRGGPPDSSSDRLENNGPR